ncbi:MAG: hypothetical protein LE178_04855 [Endomicrobium sp.]|nr:hypothetical protein [Endomicrobium sp.]
MDKTKQLSVFPGVVFAWFLIDDTRTNVGILNIFLCFLSTSLIASANYIINEYLAADYDKFHPEKKNRSVFSKKFKDKIHNICF